MTRRHDHSLPLSKRPQIANKNNADIFISIHLNSFTSSKVNGTETYYYKKKAYWLAKHVQKQLSKDLALKNNGVKRSKLYVLRNSKVSSCLIETLYMTNPKELRLVRSSKYRSKIATSIYQGIKNYFNEIQS